MGVIFKPLRWRAGGVLQGVQSMMLTTFAPFPIAHKLWVLVVFWVWWVAPLLSPLSQHSCLATLSPLARGCIVAPRKLYGIVTHKH